MIFYCNCIKMYIFDDQISFFIYMEKNQYFRTTLC